LEKVKITAKEVLKIIKAIFNPKDGEGKPLAELGNTVVSDPGLDSKYQGKTLNECLNVKYYTLKHKAISSKEVLANQLAKNGTVDELIALDRAYCLVNLSDTQRLYSKDTDMLTLSISLEYWVQTAKIPLLEWLIEDCNIALSGLRIPVTFGDQTRQAVVIFDRPIISDIQLTSQIGESALVDVGVQMILYPDATSYCNYEVSFDFMGMDGVYRTGVKVPLSTFAVTNLYTQKSIPQSMQVSNVGNVNLSRALSFALVFDGYNNEFANLCTSRALASEVGDVNGAFTMHIKRWDKSVSHTVVVKDHQITVNSDTNNEVHSLTLVSQFETLLRRF